MDSLPTTSDLDHCTTPTRNPESRRRLGLASFQRPDRMDTRQGNLQSYTLTVLHSTSGLIRISAEPPTASICVETSRPRNNGCWRSGTDVRMAQLDVIHSCTNSTTSSSREEDQRPCDMVGYCTSVAGPSLVSTLTGYARQLVDLPAITPTSEKTIYLPFSPETKHPSWKTLKMVV